MTRVLPHSTSVEPVAFGAMWFWKRMGRSWFAARPSARGDESAMRYIGKKATPNKAKVLNDACHVPRAPLIFARLKKGPVIPRKTIYRLSIYLRCLARLKENGI